MTRFAHLSSSARTMALGLAALAGLAATPSPAKADHFDLDIRIGSARPERVWVEPVYEERRTRVWVPATYRTVCERVWVEPVYRTVCERVWVEPIVETRCERVWV